ncbi:hypothetical protein SARC_07517 [Sphaeroforma arctica JP610]|uniref:BHLH domain-containing protein n=1 Tax=Sphaeroforma arctica JP610 TaxID=667725 RepID=A0A0L0FTK1_9EUKA|nr:hypothetical protein SARC_07517 [Sphaeroforma arctica JP610]KNC80117.1 hypothetical protein SARC_07517 [Sphaeroforma arctica JP610]|eukprot:XP_014154019.1 hypothetical protein SARC_07517 [Sphaeroforma arctica JP610]
MEELLAIHNQLSHTNSHNNTSDLAPMESNVSNVSMGGNNLDAFSQRETVFNVDTQGFGSTLFPQNSLFDGSDSNLNVYNGQATHNNTHNNMSHRHSGGTSPATSRDRLNVSPGPTSLFGFMEGQSMNHMNGVSSMQSTPIQDNYLFNNSMSNYVSPQFPSLLLPFTHPQQSTGADGASALHTQNFQQQQQQQQHYAQQNQHQQLLPLNALTQAQGHSQPPQQTMHQRQQQQLKPKQQPLQPQPNQPSQIGQFQQPQPQPQATTQQATQAKQAHPPTPQEQPQSQPQGQAQAQVNTQLQEKTQPAKRGNKTVQPRLFKTASANNIALKPYPSSGKKTTGSNATATGTPTLGPGDSPAIKPAPRKIHKTTTSQPSTPYQRLLSNSMFDMQTPFLTSTLISPMLPPLDLASSAAPAVATKSNYDMLVDGNGAALGHSADLIESVKERRDTNKVSERRRRDDLRAAFHELRVKVPALRDVSSQVVSKVVVLKKATDRISELEDIIANLQKKAQANQTPATENSDTELLPETAQSSTLEASADNDAKQHAQDNQTAHGQDDDSGETQMLGTG